MDEVTTTVRIRRQVIGSVANHAWSIWEASRMTVNDQVEDIVHNHTLQGIRERLSISQLSGLVLRKGYAEFY